MDIVLADDHGVVRDGLLPFVEGVAEDVRVSEAETFDEALSAARRCPNLGLVILDLYMPGMGGVTGIQAMRRLFPKVPLAVVSGSVETADALRVMESGAAAYIPKTMKGGAIQRVLRLVLGGEQYLPPFLLGSLSRSQMPAERPPGRLSVLSPRELDILRGLVDGAPNKQIARDLNLQEVTVKAHLRNIFRKMDVRNRTEAAMVAKNEGVSGRGASSYPQSCGSAA